VPEVRPCGPQSGHRGHGRRSREEGDGRAGEFFDVSRLPDGPGGCRTERYTLARSLFGAIASGCRHRPLGGVHHRRDRAVGALTAILWQYALPAHPVGSLYEEDPRLASMIQNLITGMLVQQPSRSNRQDGQATPLTCHRLLDSPGSRRAGKAQRCDMTARAASGRMGSARASWLRELMLSLAKTFPRW
jgi:hypothetical protein